ncbi:DsbA family protein [Ideonella sp. BN130291]|uniref:DsbA family protein n=1 Tax=Ideonella sp. BN130291 TaxID=3112940 RepID=UPI002E25DB03|nr:DsbA family protein [Ideonella sp. BN130291]
MSPPGPVLHYIFDPLCGWCYAAAPLVAVARELLPVKLHGGGMMAGALRRPVSPQFRSFVLRHDRQIAQVSGQPFGEAYSNVLLNDTSVVLDSGPPITAILAAESIGGRGLDLLTRLQRAHYVEGRRISRPEVLAELALDLGIDEAAFAQAWRAMDGQATLRHIEQSRDLLSALGGSGFPTLALERKGERVLLDASAHLGQPGRWRDWLATAIGPA